MSEPRARPRGDGPAADFGGAGSIEIELAGPGTATGGGDGGGARDDGTETPDEPNWRKVIATASLLGVAVGVAIAATILAGGAEPDEDDTTDTTIDPELAATLITAPPTLPPVIDPPTLDPGPTSPTSQTLDLFRDPDEQVIETSGLELPEFEPIEWSPPPGEFELTAASMPSGSSLVSELTVQRSGDTPETAEVRFDAVAGRMEIVPLDDVDFGLIFDVPGGYLYNKQNGVDWERAPVDDFSQAVGIELDDYIAGVVRGPLRAGTFPAASITADGFVAGDDGEPLGLYEVVIPIAALPERTILYGFAPARSDDTRTARFRALVRADGRLHRVDGLNPTIGGEAVLVSYVFDFDADVTIELPPSEAVTDISFPGDEPEPTPTLMPGPDYEVVGTSDLTWDDIDAALASFAPPDAMSITEWYPDGTIINRWRRSPDGRTWAFRQLTRAGPLANFEQVTDSATRTVYYRDADDPNWRVIDGEPPLGVVDDDRLDLLIDAEFLRSIGPAERVELVGDDESTAHRATLVLDPDRYDPTVLTPVAEAGIVDGWPTFVDVLVSDDGVLLGLVVTPFDANRSLAIEQRLEYDTDTVIDLPTAGG